MPKSRWVITCLLAAAGLAMTGPPSARAADCHSCSDRTVGCLDRRAITASTAALAADNVVVYGTRWAMAA